MAKVNAPLFSFGASGKIADALVYFPWKGLNAVRQYIIPSNPKSTGQVTQRGYLTDAVAAIHAFQARATQTFKATDVGAYALWASVVKAATTWFNQAVKNFVDQLVAGKSGVLWGNGSTTPGANTLAVSCFAQGVVCTTGDFWYGTSKTALIHSKVAGVAANVFTATLTGLTTGVKYYWQVRPTAPASAIGAYSGIYYGVPT